jgi:hypothetical protein
VKKLTNVPKNKRLFEIIFILVGKINIYTRARAHTTHTHTHTHIYEKR